MDENVNDSEVVDNSIFSEILDAGSAFLSKRLDFEIAKENAKNRAAAYIPRYGVGLGNGAVQPFAAGPVLTPQSLIMIALVVGGVLLLRKA